MSVFTESRILMAERLRIDRLLVERGLAESRQRAAALVLAGKVRVNGREALKAGQFVAPDAEVEVLDKDDTYVSRGGVKLAGALEEFSLQVAQWVAMDVGASTGGFTDCLLRRGVKRVYAIDVGYGQLTWKLRNDSRVVVLERCNVRYLTHEQVPELVDLAVIDISFISL
jgi:23S rRNA (cytidine1920-2'-O)/16S rRNA (cytidine1409-2'-O)-methyltransferase